MNGPKIYFTIPIFGGIPITQTIVSSFVVMVCLCVAGILLGRNLQKRPSRRQVLVEKGVSMLYGMVEDTMGKHNAYWTPYIGALFLSSICGSYIGMTGIFRSATADLTEPIVVMTPMNLVSEIAQPISMAFRHFGNIAGGSVLTSLVYSALATVSAVLLGLVGKNIVVSAVVLVIGIALLVFIATGILALLGLSGVPYLEVGIPGILSLYFDVFSGGVQALVFSLLTMVYVGNACPPPEEA